jgi:polygalacturonase
MKNTKNFNEQRRIITKITISAAFSLLLAVALFSTFASMSNNTSFNVKAYGAKGDGITKDTIAIQSAIDAAHNAGGGKVEVPPGVYLTGSIFLKSNVEFHIQNGATIKGSPNKLDYHLADICPQNSASPKTGDNTSGSHLVLCIAQTNVTISGNGKIDGNSSAFLLDKNGKIHQSKAHSGKVLNSVGAGDSMLAGFICGVENGYEYAFKLSLAAGSATAFSYNLATKEEIYNLFN